MLCYIPVFYVSTMSGCTVCEDTVVISGEYGCSVVFSTLVGCLCFVLCGPSC